MLTRTVFKLQRGRHQGATHPRPKLVPPSFAGLVPPLMWEVVGGAQGPLLPQPGLPCRLLSARLSRPWVPFRLYELTKSYVFVTHSVCQVLYSWGPSCLTPCSIPFPTKPVLAPNHVLQLLTCPTTGICVCGNEGRERPLGRGSSEVQLTRLHSGPFSVRGRESRREPHMPLSGHGGVKSDRPPSCPTARAPHGTTLCP